MKKQFLHFQELQFFGIVLYLETQLCLQQYRQQIRINILWEPQLFLEQIQLKTFAILLMDMLILY
jgi:hypothetical protein